MKSFMLSKSATSHWVSIVTAWVAAAGMGFLVACHIYALSNLERDSLVDPAPIPRVPSGWLALGIGSAAGAIIGILHVVLRYCIRPNR